MNNPNALDIINAVKRDVQHVDESSFPLEVFPAKMQEILLHWAEHVDYKLEFAGMAMLSAMAAAVGNTYRMRIKGDWTTNTAMFVILVGRPGTGKTPPLNAALRPLVELDVQRLEKFKLEMESFQEQSKGKKGEEQSQDAVLKPKLIKTIVSDITPEKMVQVHADNLRGIIVHVDEVMALFNAANRYNSSPFIEQLLSTWSNSALDYARVSNPIPIHIDQPFIGIIGTTQTARINELLQKGFRENGFLDRILFVLPKSQKIAEWKAEDLVGGSASQKQSSAMTDKWKGLMKKIFALDYQNCTYEGEARQTSHILTMNEEAAQEFAEWWNKIARKNNAIENDCDVESRDMKVATHLGKLSLLFQIARYACGESHLEFIDATSVRCAIKVMEYLEESFERIKDALASSTGTDQTTRWLAHLTDTFTTAAAIDAGKKVGIQERNVANKLNALVADGIIHKVKHGVYEKTRKSGMRSNVSAEESQSEE